MPSDHVKIEVRTEIEPSARVLQCMGMFDMSIEAANTVTWEHHLPLDDKPWNVGLIVGPSGSGKSVLARELWPDLVRERFDWSHDRTVVDDFPRDMPTREITELLSSVGLGSAPSWIRPYHTLSNGEQFRADMARALAESTDFAVIDEFTSVVDRQVARVAAHSVQKTVRRRDSQFVAVTCHYDVEDWLQPDWVYDVSRANFVWRSVQPRPTLELTIRRAARADWKAFSRHHYMNPNLMKSAVSFIATVNDEPVAFNSYRHFPHAQTRNIKMVHRLVVMPDWQGLGIAGVFSDWMGQYLWDRGYRLRSVVAHPGMIHLHSRSPRWRSTGAQSKSVATSAKSSQRKHNLSSRRLAVRSFEYRAPRAAAVPD